MSDEPTVVTGDGFMKHMYDAGLLPENTYRVIIDCKVGQIAKIHYSTYATDKIALIVVEAADEFEIDPESEA